MELRRRTGDVRAVYEQELGRTISPHTVTTVRRLGHINPHWLTRFEAVAHFADAAPRIGITPEETIRFLRGNPAWRTDAIVVDDLHLAVRNAVARVLAGPHAQASNSQLSALDDYLGVRRPRAARWETAKPERPALIFRGASDRDLIALAAGITPVA